MAVGRMQHMLDWINLSCNGQIVCNRISSSLTATLPPPCCCACSFACKRYEYKYLAVREGGHKGVGGEAGTLCGLVAELVYRTLAVSVSVTGRKKGGSCYLEGHRGWVGCNRVGWGPLGWVVRLLPCAITSRNTCFVQASAAHLAGIRWSYHAAYCSSTTFRPTCVVLQIGYYDRSKDIAILRATRQCAARDIQFDKTLCESTVLVPY
jgi:hypothetical protein